MFTPVAAIYCADFFILRRQAVYRAGDFIPAFNICAIAAWITGILFSFSSAETGLFITPIEAIDALIISLASYLFLSRAMRVLTNKTAIKNSANSATPATITATKDTTERENL
ncbi:Cytosine permease (fragment) [Alteromonas sp. 38]